MVLWRGILFRKATGNATSALSPFSYRYRVQCFPQDVTAEMRCRAAEGFYKPRPAGWLSAPPSHLPSGWLIPGKLVQTHKTFPQETDCRFKWPCPNGAASVTRPDISGAPRTALKSGSLHSSWVERSSRDAEEGKGRMNIMLDSFSSATRSPTE